MNWAKIWMNLFGTTEFLGIDMGFWVAMAADRDFDECCILEHEA